MSENRHVFISYSSKDINYVMQITEAMELSGISYWRAPDRIPAGSNYAKEIPKAIRECDLFLLVYSDNAQQSIWVEKEIDMAVCCKKTILPVKIDNCEFNELFKFYLNNIQMLQAQIVNGKIANIIELIIKIRELRLNQNHAESEMVTQKLANSQEKMIITDESNIEEKINTFSEYRIQRKSVDKRSNALRMNRIPLECEFCGGNVELESIGVYICKKCGRENYDDFYKVRRYVETYGPAPAIVISRHTGVSRTSIEFFLNS